MTFGILDLQKALKAANYDPGPLDGLRGPMTRAAFEAWWGNDGAARAPRASEPPWVTEGKKVFGLHEERNKAELSAWLKSDGKALGDPVDLPWCGDFAETCIRRALPREPFVMAMENPYWALNWKTFGVPCSKVYGCVGVFTRDGGGHVGFLVGQDSTSYYVLGGNQGNGVNISRLAAYRLVATRWPSTYPVSTAILPGMSAAGIPTSVNEF